MRSRCCSTTSGLSFAQAILARSLLAQGNLKAARDAASQSVKLSLTTVPQSVRFDALLADGRVKAKSAMYAEAHQELQTALAAAHKSGYRLYEYELRLSLGEIEMGGAPSTWTGFGGTSVAAPAMASIQALVEEEWGIRAGNPNPTYYSIAKTEFGAAGNTACYSINQPPPRGLATSCVFYDITQGDTVVDCRYNGTNDADGVGCYLPSGTTGALSTQALTTGTVITAGSGYTTAPTCTIGAPSNLNEYLSPSGGTLWAGGTQATCTATIDMITNAVSSITIVTAGAGYAGGASCALTGGGGTGATCSVSPVMGTVASAYQPAYGATPGWDFATGIGSVNAYNLVFNSAW